MAGHSHFANIMHKKGRADVLRGKAFSKISRLIMSAVRVGGPKPEDNPRLSLAIEKARAANMPKDTIKRAIDRASGTAEGVDYLELTYEGYGPNGVAMLIDALTDNRNRTGGEVRLIFDRNGGSMGASGSVAWMFERKGECELKADATSEEELFELAVEAGADDVSQVGEGDEAIFLITSEVAAFEDVKKALAEAGLATVRAELAMVPKNTVEADEETARKIIRIQGLFENNDDVQTVTTNLEVSSEIAAKLAAE